MIKIIKGIYGNLENGVVKPLTPDDNPFSLSKEKEEELVRRGIAERVGSEKAEKSETPRGKGKNKQPEGEAPEVETDGEAPPKIEPEAAV